MEQQIDTVSWSEIQAWCTCRQKWHWSYERRIVPKKVERAPSIGSCGHAAIAAHLSGGDWNSAVNGWLDTEINRRPLFDEEIQERQEIADLIRHIIPRYIDYYQDTFRTVFVEQRFEVPVAGVKIKLIGYWDALVEDQDGHLWLLEHKFPKQRFRSEEDMELDGQIGVYQWAAHRLGFNIVGTIMNQLIAKTPTIPSVNKDGSVSRAKVYTDWPTYEKTVREQGQDPLDYFEMKDKLADFKFFQRNYVYRPLVEVRLFTKDVQRRIWDMRKAKKHIYRSESHMTCSWCSYRELCLESVKGGDVDYLIENLFEAKKSREEVELVHASEQERT